MRKELSRFVIVSIILHALFLLGVATSNSGNSKEKGTNNGSGRAIDHGNMLNKRVEVEIRIPTKAQLAVVKKIPKRKTKKEKKSNAGYYGIGVQVSAYETHTIYRGVMYSSAEIVRISAGNPADLSGLRPGDMIFMVDGKEWDTAERMIGKDRTVVQVGIKRGEDIFFVNIQRDWIETRKMLHDTN